MDYFKILSDVRGLGLTRAKTMPGQARHSPHLRQLRTAAIRIVRTPNTVCAFHTILAATGPPRGAARTSKVVLIQEATTIHHDTRAHRKHHEDRFSRPDPRQGAPRR